MEDSHAAPGGEPARNQATRLLIRIDEGDSTAIDELFPLVYEELRRVAAGYFRDQPAGHTLQPTAVVHEAFMKLVAHPSGDWRGRQHFMAVAARAMRQILIDHARGKARMKRGGGAERVPLEEIESPSGGSRLDALALERALEKLSGIDPRQVQIIELWFFAGLTMAEVAEVLGVSERTVRRDWRYARAWLNHEIASAGDR